MTVTTPHRPDPAPPAEGSDASSPPALRRPLHRPVHEARRVLQRHPVLVVAAAAALAGLATLAVAAAVGGAGRAPLLGDPGVLTRWGLLVARLVHDVTAVATIGVTSVAVLALRPVEGRLGEDATRLVGLAGRWAAVWAASAAALVVLTLSDLTGHPVWRVLTPGVLPLALDLPVTRALVSSAWLAVLVVVFARFTRSWLAGGLLLVMAGVAAVPTLLIAHAAHEDSHRLAVASLVTHVLAASVWVGGLLALALHLRTRRAVLAEALPRWSLLALLSFVAVGGSGVVVAALLLQTPDQLWGSAYGVLVLGKVLALVVLGGLGWAHRRWTVRRVLAGRPRAFLVLAAAELVLVAATAGLAVGLARTAPPESLDDHAAAAVTVVVAVAVAERHASA